MEEDHFVQKQNFFLRNKWKILIGGIIIILVVVGVYFAKLFLHPPEYSYIVKAGAGYASDVYRYNPESSELTQFFFAKEGQQITPVDMVPVDDESFYYIQFERFEPSVVANVFLRTKEGTDVRITNSDTMKYALQVADDGTVVFQEKQVAKTEELFDQRPWKIVLVRAGSNTQEVIAEGTTPSFLRESTVIVFRSASGLERYDTSNRETIQLASDIGAYAVDNKSGALLVENSLTNQLDIFDILDDASLTYRASRPLPNKISAITSRNGDAMVGYTSAASGKEQFVIENLTSGKIRDFNLTPSRLPSVQTQIISLQVYE